MIARVIGMTAWLGLGGTILASLYWLFLNTPETNTLTLGASAALLVALLLVLALLVNGAILLARGTKVVAALTSSIRGIPWFLITLVPLGLVWWAITASDAWVARHSGEINAWFIARFGWADISSLLRAETWIARWVGWVVAPLAALSLLAALLDSGRGGARHERWLRRAWHWRTLALATLVFVTLFVIPWQIVTWRPRLPPTWVEPAVAAARLLAVAMLWSLGAALLVLLSAGSRPPRSALRAWSNTP